MALLFESINLYGSSVGTLNVDNGDAFQWTSRNGEKTKEYKLEDIKEPSWAVLGQYGYLKLEMKDGDMVRMEGFGMEDYKKLKHLFASKEKKLLKENIATGGGNYADFEFKGNRIVFTVDEKHLLEIDAQAISQCVLPGNNKKDNTVELMFPIVDEGVGPAEERLTSLRLWVPPGEDAEEEGTGAERFQAEVLERANIGKVKGDVLVELGKERGNFLTPRGKYTLELYQDFMRMYGAKYDYKIRYGDVAKLFLLRLPDQYRHAFVFALTRPVRQGQQRYENLVLQLTEDEEELALNLSEEACQERFAGELQPRMSGPLCNLVARAAKHLMGKKVYVPGKFRSAQDLPCLKCALKASEGLLYPMEKNFVFIHKPTVIVPFSDVHTVSFQRYSGQGMAATKNFDCTVSLKGGGGGKGRGGGGGEGKDLVFSGIMREEYAPLLAFLGTKKLTVLAAEEPAAGAVGALASLLGEEGELDEGEDSEEDDGDFDPEAQARKDKARRERDEGSGTDLGSDDDDISYASEDSDDAEEAKPKKEKKEKKVKKSKPASPKKEAKPAAGKKRKKKDKNAPKQAKSAYFFFAEAMRDQLKAENPEASFGELGKLTGAKWKEIDAESKVEYEQKAAKDKERYQAEMADYVPPEDSGDDDDDEPAKGSKKKRKKKDPNAPKGPQSAYILFATAERESIKNDHPEAQAKDIMRIAGERWRGLDAEGKAPWEARAAEGKAAHKVALQEYQDGQKKTAAAAAAAKGGSAAGSDDDDEMLSDDEDEKKISAKGKKKLKDGLPDEEEELLSSDLSDDDDDDDA